MRNATEWLRLMWAVPALWAVAAGAQEPVAKEEGAKAGKPQATCPVMGGKIDRKLYADHQGKRVYFCCGGCEGTFKKDPAKFVRQLESQGVTLDKLQTTCPVMGGKIDRKLYADHQGKRVYFCCGGCDEKFKASPDKFLKQLAADGVALEDAPSAKPKAAAQGHNHGGSTQGSGCGGCCE